MKIFKVILNIILAISFGFVSSCSKDDYVDNDEGIYQTAYINIDINAIILEDSENSFNKFASLSNESRDLNFQKPSIQTEYLDNSFYSEFTVNESTRKSSVATTSLKDALKNKTAAKEGANMPVYDDISKYKKLEEGVRYMVLIFDNEDNHIGTTLTSVGKEQPIPVRFKDDYIPSPSNYYRIVAFTFNTKDDRDFDGLNLDPTQTNNKPEIVFPSDKEFYYHNAGFSFNPNIEYSSPLKIDIILLPQTVKIGVTVDARGVGAKVKRVKGSFGRLSYRQSARFDLKLNNVLERVDVAEDEFPYDFSIEGDSDTLSFGRYIYLEADETVNLEDFEVTLSDLVIQRNDSTYVTEVLKSPTTKSFSFKNVSLTKEKFYNGRINLLSGFEINGIVWALGNLYYDKSDIGNEFKIRHYANEGKGASATDYWYQNDRVFTVVTDSTVGAISGNTLSYKYESIQGDPCSHVYPKNTWRMPSHAEPEVFFAKNAASGLEFRYDKVNKKSRFVEYRKAGTSTPVLRFYAHGYYNLVSHLTPNLIASFFINSYTGGSTSWTDDSRALVFAISKTMTK